MNVLLFFVLLLVLLMLPFVPGMMELRRKQDAEPLRVVRNYEVNVMHFANRFREFIDTQFGQDLETVQNQAQTKPGKLDNGSEYCVLGPDMAIPFEEAENRSQETNRMFLAASDLSLSGNMRYLNELYANGTITGADESTYRAMLAGADIRLGQNSTLLRWMHAKDIQIASGGVMYGRVSADRRIVITGPSRFQRLNAPQILFGKNMPPEQTGPARQEIQPEDLTVKVEEAVGRWLIEDDLELADNSRIHASLVVTGNLRLGNNCEIYGSIKSHKPLHIQEGCIIHGSVVSVQDIHIGAGASIMGPLISEANIHIASNCRLGADSAPTTISAQEIHFQPDCVVHGTVWARSAGTLS
jgi:cytoskeletal protein CcmA (bactofilin family)